MCDPITIAAIASTAATVGGNYLQQKNNNASNAAQVNARNAAAAEGVKQQQPNIQQGQDTLNQTIQKFSGENQANDLGSLVASRTSAINANDTPATGTADPLTNISNAPQVVKSDLADKIGKATAYANQQGGALGKMGATGDLFNNNAITLANSGTDLNNLTSKANEEARVNLMKQNSDAANARKAPSSLGELLSTAGTIGGIASAAGGGFTNIFNGAGQTLEGGLRAVSNLPPGPIPLTGSGIWSALTA